jgi:orotidine-5'-phosphate decarboxylase
MNNPAANERLIVALDVPSAADAVRLADSLSGICTWVKVGLELFIAAGPAIVTGLKTRGFSVFLDLKLHDIPNTVAGAVRSAAATGADMLTVHASGGPAMLAAAAEAASDSAHPVELLAVTVLTSMDSAQLNAIGVAAEPADQVARLARLAADSGLRGMVCSPNEVAMLRRIFGDTVRLVTPGIRPAESDVQDQKRIATPAKSIQDGASYLVVGRPITQAPDPRSAAEAIQREIAEALVLQT